MRGQVTLFIIVGILLLVVVGIFLYVGSDARGDVFSESVPQEYIPVQSFVESCISKTGEDALKILGERGGYIFNEEYALESVYGITVDNSIKRADHNLIPLWHYLNGNVVSSKRPELQSGSSVGIKRMDNSVESQIDKYVNTHLQNCLDYEVLDFDIVEDESPITTTFITESDVIINIDYPIEIINGEDVRSIKRFGTRIDVPLKQMYDLASLITKNQAEFSFLETFTTNLLSAYSGLDKPLAPLYDFTFIFGDVGKYWDKEDMRNSFNEIIAFNLNFLQVEGSSNFERVSILPTDGAYAVRKKTYDDFILPVVSTQPAEIINQIGLTNTEVDFQYLGDMDFEVEGGKPTIIGIESVGFGFQKYETLYSVSLPVIVELQRSEALGGKGYRFNFGIQGVVKNNQPAVDFASFATDFYDAPKLCDNKDKNVTINVFDDSSPLLPISGMPLIFKTSTETCILGVTNSSGSLTTLLPGGVLGAWIETSNSDYLSEGVQYSSSANVYTLNGVRQFKNFSVEVLEKVMKKDPVYKFLNSTPEPLKNKAIIIMKRINFEGDDGAYETSFVYPETKEVRLVDGSYAIKIISMGSPDVNQTVQAVDTIGKYSEKMALDLLKSPAGSLVGGVEFTEEFPVLFGRSDIKNNSHITFYSMRFEDLTFADDVTTRIPEFTNANIGEVLPKVE